jgi:hypothetical protein
MTAAASLIVAMCQQQRQQMEVDATRLRSNGACSYVTTSAAFGGSSSL